MIRCVRMWTGEDGDSLFEEGWIDLAEGVCGDSVGEAVPVVELSFQETRSGRSYEWHQDPVPRFVITLSGTLEFKTKSGATFIIRPGDVLLAQDNSGTGHKWKLIGDDPWRRAYVVYENEADLDFKPANTEGKCEHRRIGKPRRRADRRSHRERHAGYPSRGAGTDARRRDVRNAS